MTLAKNTPKKSKMRFDTKKLKRSLQVLTLVGAPYFVTVPPYIVRFSVSEISK